MHIYTWHEVARHLATLTPGTVLAFDKARIQHPRDGGLTPSLGLPVGQRGDWRYSYPSCGGLHVRDFGRSYSAHLDRVNPNCNPVDHVMQDTPQISGGAALGALIGLMLGRSKESALIGAAIGAIVGMSKTAAAERAATPTTVTDGQRKR